MNILKEKDTYEYNALWFVKNIMTKLCPGSFELYFKKDMIDMIFDVKIYW